MIEPHFVQLFPFNFAAKRKSPACRFWHYKTIKWNPKLLLSTEYYLSVTPLCEEERGRRRVHEKRGLLASLVFLCEKQPKSKAFSASLVEGGLLHDPHGESLTPKKPCSPPAGGLPLAFLFAPVVRQAWACFK
jgi:hypothetical protein